MTTSKLTVIDGARDKIEQDLAEALFGTDKIEIIRLVNLLNEVSNKQANLSLVRTDIVNLRTKKPS